MSDLAEQSYGLKRSVPEEWPGLIELAASTLPPSGDISRPNRDTVAQIFSVVSSMDNEPLEINRYYGLGLAMCGFARTLQDPEIRQNAIDWVADGVSHDYFRCGTRNGLRPRDLRFVMDEYQPFVHVATNAIAAMPLPTQVVTDSLVAVAAKRQKRDESSNLAQIHTVLTVTGTYTAAAVGANATAGTTMLLRRVLTDPSIAPVTAEDGSPLSRECLADLAIDKTALRNLDIHKLAVQSALLRLDEFGKVVNQEGTIVTDKTGKRSLDRAYFLQKLPSPCPEESPTGKLILHTRRLECPAVQIPGLVALMLDIVPEIILATQQKIKTYQGDSSVVH